MLSIKIRDRESNLKYNRQKFLENTLNFSGKLNISNKNFDKIHPGAINSLDFDNDKKFLLVAGANEFVYCYSMDLTQRNNYVQLASKCNTSNIAYSINTISWYPHDDAFFVTSSLEPVIHIWETETFKSFQKITLSHGCKHHVFNKHNILISAATQNYISLIDIRSCAVVQILKDKCENIQTLEWANYNEYYLVSGGYGMSHQLWDIRKPNSLLQTFDYSTIIQKRRIQLKNDIISITNTSSVHVAALSNDGCLYIWNILKGSNFKFIENLNVVKRRLKVQCAFSKVNSRIYIPSCNNVMVVDCKNYKTSVFKNGHVDTLNCLYYDDSRQNLISGSKDYHLICWDIQNYTKNFNLYQNNSSFLDS
ncbi:DNA excision repair protein ERCC-8 [Intoshia linei]|uniref:DNA excision repair protein ERCC-8 n=1 Tax=Intoshia linei TaxID=1819745 RepID=A0A177AYU5_9BILA|nr:DNA excision repair protein ERCC-8 [Intoshia linei]